MTIIVRNADVGLAICAEVTAALTQTPCHADPRRNPACHAEPFTDRHAYLELHPNPSTIPLHR